MTTALVITNSYDDMHVHAVGKHIIADEGHQLIRCGTDTGNGRFDGIDHD